MGQSRAAVASRVIHDTVRRLTDFQFKEQLEFNPGEHSFYRFDRDIVSGRYATGGEEYNVTIILKGFDGEGTAHCLFSAEYPQDTIVSSLRIRADRNGNIEIIDELPSEESRPSTLEEEAIVGIFDNISHWLK